MKRKDGKKMLVIMSSWPSREHPYLVYLFHGLKQQFPNLTLFLFRKEIDVTLAENLIGQIGVNDVLKGASYRFNYSKNPLKYGKPLLKLLNYPIESCRLFRKCLKAGYSTYQALGQLLYNYQLIGNRFDLVYVNALQSAKHLPLRVFFPKAALIASSRGQDFDFNPTAYDSILNQLDHLHVLGGYLKGKAIQRGFDQSRITIIPPAILPLKLIDTRLNQSSKIIITSISRLVWTKGHRYSLEAIRKLRKMVGDHVEIRYVIIGDGPDMEYLKLEIDRLNLNDAVELKGWMGQQDINEHLQQTDIFLHLSIEEGFNNAVMQAQQATVPCVVSDAGGLPENVLHKKTGFVVPRYDAEQAADYLLELINNPSLRVTMGNAARKRMMEEFSLKMQIDKYGHMFELLLNRS